jgi:hypothetical protein
VAESERQLPRTFPDRAIRDALVDPLNLRDFLARTVPELVDRFDFSRLEVVDPAFLLDDWRRREADVLVRLPYRDESKDRTVLVCVLVEHQSSPDQAMPLRLLVYAVLYWEREWRAWEESHARGQPLRLTPVLPLVLHTGADRWDTNRILEQLFEGAEALRAWLPQWPMRLFDLAEHDPADLLGGSESFWNALAVARAEREEPERFLEVLRQAVERLEPLGQHQPVRWHELLQLVLYWALFRRSGGERGRILETVRTSHREVTLQHEVDTMAKQAWPSYEQELIAQGEARAYRKILERQLREKFGPLPEELVHRIATAEPGQLESALASVFRLNSLDELNL